MIVFFQKFHRKILDFWNFDRVDKLRGESLRGARREPRRAAAAVIF
jgi:hypothetical protein